MKRDFCSDFENNKLSELENEPETLSESTKKGAVTLVGAGCGKGLITAAGIEALKKAECVIYDDLIDDELLELPESKNADTFMSENAREDTAFRRILLMS